jgi:microcystin-dependent protein
MSEPFIGQIQSFGFSFAPVGWAQCNGQLIPISGNEALFALLGTTYGGNGTTTFGLPDLRGRVQIHMGNGPGLTPRTIGSASGNESSALTVNQMPIHNHVATLNAAVKNATDTIPNARALGVPNTPAYIDSKANEAMRDSSVVIANAGNNAPIPGMEPYLTINWCIALEGVFPPGS